MIYKFIPIYIHGEGVVKLIDGGDHYSTHIPPYIFEIDESKGMFICGKEYDVDKETALKLAESGYLEMLSPSPLEDL